VGLIIRQSFIRARLSDFGRGGGVLDSPSGGSLKRPRTAFSFFSGVSRSLGSFLLLGCDWNFQVGTPAIDENAGDGVARRPTSARTRRRSPPARAGSSKLMKLKFAESFLSTEITEMPIDPRQDSALSREGDTPGAGEGLGSESRRAGEDAGGGNYLSRKSIFAVAAALPTGIPNLILFDVTIRARLLLNNDDVPGESASERANAINRRLAFVSPLFFFSLPRHSGYSPAAIDTTKRHCKDNSPSPPLHTPPPDPLGTREIDARNRIYPRKRGHAILAKLRNVP